MTEMKRGPVLLWTGGFALLLALVAAIGAGVLRTPLNETGSPAPPGDLAVLTLTGPNRLVTVDLETMRIVSDIRLRSFVSDLSLDASSGLAVTAQGGGLGDEADDVVGVYDVRRGGRVSYVKLDCPNPGFVAVIGGKAFVEHGMYRENGPGGSKGMLASVVDIAGRSLESTALVPPSLVSCFGVQDGLLWDLTAEIQDGDPPADAAGRTLSSLTALDPGSLESRLVGKPLSANQVIGAGPGRLYLLEGAAHSIAGAVSEVTTDDARVVRRVELPSLPHGARHASIAGRWLAVTEWDGLDLDDPGTRIAWVDRSTLSVGGTLEVKGGPCAIAGWGERIVVVERETSRLLVIDPAEGRVVSSLDLGGVTPVVADLEILTRG